MCQPSPDAPQRAPCLASPAPASSSPAALPAQSSAALLERLRLTAVIASLDTPGSQPFHLKATIQLDAQYQSPAEQGTVELWYDAANRRRIAYDFPSYHATFLETPTGRYYAGDATSAPYLVSAVLDLILHPLPQSFENSKATLEKRNLGKIALDCITVVSEQQKRSEPTTYCLSPEKSELIITFAPDGQNSVNESFSIFHDRRPTMRLVLTFSGRPAAHIRGRHIGEPDRALPGNQRYDSGLTPQTHIHRDRPRPCHGWKNSQQGGSCLSAVSQEPTTISGAVLLEATIGLERFKIEALHVVGSPDEANSRKSADRRSKPVVLPALPTQRYSPSKSSTTITVRYAPVPHPDNPPHHIFHPLPIPKQPADHRYRIRPRLPHTRRTLARDPPDRHQRLRQSTPAPAAPRQAPPPPPHPPCCP